MAKKIIDDDEELTRLAEEKWENDELTRLAEEKWERENSVQIQDPDSKLEQLETGIRGALSGATLGLSEPVISGGQALVQSGLQAYDTGELPSLDDVKGYYTQDVERRNQLQDQYPVTDVVGNIAGAISPGGLATKAFKGAQGLVSGLQKAPVVGKALTPIVGAGVGAGAEALGRNVVLEGTGFQEEGEVSSAPEQAAFAAGMSSIPLIGKGIKAGAGVLTSSFVGVRPQTASAFLKNIDKIKKLESEGKSRGDIAQNISDTVKELEAKAAEEGLNLTSAVQLSLADLKNQVIQKSEIAYDILDQSKQTVPKSFVLGLLNKSASPLKQKGVIGDSANTARTKVNALIEDLNTLDEKVPLTDLKNILKSIDRETDWGTKPSEFNDLTDRVYKSFRRDVDQYLKKNNPEYGTAMEAVSSDAKSLSVARDIFGDEAKTLSQVKKYGKTGQELISVPAEKFMKDRNIPIEKYVELRDSVDQFKNWKNAASVETKIKGLISGRSTLIKGEFDRLAKLTNEDLVSEINTLKIIDQLNTETTQGSRKVNLWGALGAASSFLAGGGLTEAGAIAGVGASVGAILDKYGTNITRQVLEGYSRLQGIPTIKKINKIYEDLPAQAREDIMRDFVRATTIMNKDNRRIQIPEESKAEMAELIKQNKKLTPIEKAKNINALTQDDEVLDYDKIIGIDEFKNDYPESDIKQPQEPDEFDIDTMLNNIRKKELAN